MGKVFISYRKKDKFTEALKLRDMLVDRLGPDAVFFDDSNLAVGDTWDDRIKSGLEQCFIFLALIGDFWHEPLESGGRRLDDPQDFLRMEVETAIDRRLHDPDDVIIMPVLLGQNPKLPDSLPGTLNELRKIQHFVVRPGRDQQRQFGDLVNDVAQKLKNQKLRPSSRFLDTSPATAFGLTSESGATLYVRRGAHATFGRMADVHLPFGGFEEIETFTPQRQAAWNNISRRHLQLSCNHLGVIVKDVRAPDIRERFPATFDGTAWSKDMKEILVPPTQESVYEVRGVVRLLFQPTLYFQVASTANDSAAEGIARKSGIGGCQVRVQWPDETTPGNDVLCVLWHAARLEMPPICSDDTFLLTDGEKLWLGSLAPDGVRVDGKRLLDRELVPLAPGRKIEVDGSDLYTVVQVEWPCA